MNENLMTVLTFALTILSMVIATYGAILTARVRRWSDAKLKEAGITEEAKWRDDLKAGLLTGAKAALLEGKSIPEAIRAAISHTLASNSDAAAGLNPSVAVLERLAKAAVADAAAQVPDALGKALADAGVR